MVQDIQIDVIADMNVLTVATVEGRLYDRIPADLSQQLPEDGLSSRLGFCPIVEPEQSLGLLAFSVQVKIKTVVDFSGQHFSLFRFLRASRDSCS